MLGSSSTTSADAVRPGVAVREDYRHDIQGIRAISALLIAIYHIWINKVSGGVDVFFVISGFLMTGVLIRQIQQFDRIQPLIFWGNLIKRIAPGACTVLLVTLAAGYFIVPEPLWNQLIQETLFSALNLENLELMNRSVDYLNRELPPSPVQQFWALSTQVQFYALLAPLLMLALWIGRRCGAAARSAVLVALGMTAAFSLLYSVLETAREPVSTYFNPAARVWEFFAGGLLALLLPRIRLQGALRNLFGLLGLATLLLFGLLAPQGSQFPGSIALIPVAAAVMLIVAGSGAEPSIASRWLASRHLAGLGRISFGVYLWHWPLLAFALEYLGSTRLDVPQGLLVIVLAILLAMATHRFVEEPIRNHRYATRRVWVPYVIGLLLLSPVLASAATWKFYIRDVVAEERNSNAHLASPEDFAPAEVQIHAGQLSEANLITAKVILPASYQGNCHQQITRPEVVYCAYGDTSSSTTVALVGGSHATQWLPALERIGKAYGLKVLNITKKECPFGATEGSHPSCAEWNSRLIDTLAELRPQVVITNSTTTTHPEIREYVPPAYVQQWRRLEQLGIPVIGIRDNPSLGFDPATCVARHRDNLLACSKPRSKSLAERDPSLEHLGELGNLHLVDMSEFLCTAEQCLTVTHDFLMYRDGHHLNPRYVLALSGRLHEQLALAIPEVFRR